MALHKKPMLLLSKKNHRVHRGHRDKTTVEALHLNRGSIYLHSSSASIGKKSKHREKKPQINADLMLRFLKIL